MNMATVSFCAQETEIDGRARRITLSKIFLWYASDFGDTTYEVLEWMLRYLPAGDATILQGLLGAWGISPPKVAYRKYDWGLNSKSRNDADDEAKKNKVKKNEKKPAVEEMHRTRSESMLVPTRQPGNVTRPRSMSDCGVMYEHRNRKSLKTITLRSRFTANTPYPQPQATLTIG